MRALVWFRADLRVSDNPALHQAARAADEGVVGLFVVTPGQWRRHDWGPTRVDFLLRNLRQLSRALEKLGIPLVVETTESFADVPELLLETARRLDCGALFFNRELEINESRRDRRVEKLFTERAITTRTFDDQTLVPPGTLATGAGSPYKVFTPFHRAWERTLEHDPPPAPLPPPEPAAAPAFPASQVPRSVAGFDLDTAAGGSWEAGEEAAHSRLRDFLQERAGDYVDTRDVPMRDGTSRISPYLALGVISPRTVLTEAAAAGQGDPAGGGPGLGAWIRQLAWRDFYRHILVGFPRVGKSRAFKPETEAIAWRHDEASLAAWQKGRTGVPILDAGMRQLAATGWMHNRSRMLTAMFLTKQLLIDWRLGEAFFMRSLVDGDFANNNGGWQWSASTGTDAAPYFRVFNPWTQGKRYDPDGEYVRRWVPELRRVDPTTLHDEKRMNALGRLGLEYPLPIVDHGPTRRRAIRVFETLSKATDATRGTG